MERKTINHRPHERRLTPSIMQARVIAFGLVGAIIAGTGWYGVIGLAVLVGCVNLWWRLRYGEWMDYL